MNKNQSTQLGHAMSHQNPLCEYEIDYLLAITHGDPHYNFLLLEQITATELAAAIIADSKNRHPSNYSGRLWLKERQQELCKIDDSEVPDWIVIAAADRLEAATRKIDATFDIINDELRKRV